MRLPRFYCPTCNEFKNRFQVKYNDDSRVYWFDCKWCHKRVIPSTVALTKVLKLANDKLKKNS